MWWIYGGIATLLYLVPIISMIEFHRRMPYHVEFGMSRRDLYHLIRTYWLWPYLLAYIAVGVLWEEYKVRRFLRKNSENE